MVVLGVCSGECMGVWWFLLFFLLFLGGLEIWIWVGIGSWDVWMCERIVGLWVLVGGLSRSVVG